MDKKSRNMNLDWELKNKVQLGSEAECLLGSAWMGITSVTRATKEIDYTTTELRTLIKEK